MFHFGIALVFFAVAACFVFLIYIMQPSSILGTTPVEYDEFVRQSIVEEKNIESLRSMALLYYDQSALSIRALEATAAESLNNVLYFTGFGMLTFIIAGILSLRLKPS